MKVAQKLAIKYVRARVNILALVSKRKAAEKAFKIFCTPFRKTSKQIPPFFEKAEKLHFEMDGMAIKGYRFNHPQETKVLIIHGFESASKNFEKYIPHLINKGYEVLAFDAPAHGRSDGKEINLPLYLKTLQQIDQRYGPINRFISHSFGGITLSHLLETLPQNENMKAVFIAPATETATSIDLFFTFLKFSPEIRKEFENVILEKGGQPLSYYSIRRAIKNIHGPVLWIHDEDDDITPIKDAIVVKNDNPPNVEFHFTKGLGHRKIYRDTEVVRKVVEFL